MKKRAYLFMAIAALSVAGASGASDSYNVYTPGGLITVTPLKGNAFQVTRRAPGDKAPAPVSETTRMRNWSDGDRVVFQGIGATLSVGKRTGEVFLVNAAGDTLLSEKSPLKFNTPKGTAFYGAGERGKSLRLGNDTLVQWNRPNYGYGEGDPRISQMGITMPYLLADTGYGILFNDDSRSTIAFTGDGFNYDTSNPGTISYTIVYGKDMPGTTANFTKVAGRQDLPPFWSLGYITSKYGYHTDKEALGAVDSLKRRGYPVDGLIFDLYWYGKETDMGRLEWNPEQFPDPRRMLDSLNNMGVKTVLIHQPYINKKGALDNYNLLNDARMLTYDSAGNTVDVPLWVGESGMFDISNPPTREWLWNRLSTITGDGVYGWWGDLGEPEQHPLDIVHANGLTANDYHNRYGNDWSRMVYEGLRRDFPERRPFVMMRGGTTGLQKYSVFPWTGDVARSWQGLQPQIKLLLNSGLSGLGYMGSDIGGFAVDKNHPYDPELYVRWMQMGVFNPILRTHAQDKPEPYHYPAQQKILLNLVKMRYQWLPYNYTLAYENASAGQPLARPINYYGGSERYSNVSDEYLWGREVLVAPVMNPGVRTRKVVFPDMGKSGKDAPVWINWFNPSRSYRGGTEANVPVTLDRFPLFVKAGSFIPLYTRPMKNTGDYDPQYLTVKYYASDKPSEYTLFDDDRESPTTLQERKYQLTTFSNTGRREIVISSDGEYLGMPAERHITLEIVGITRPAQVTINGKRATGVSYNATTRTATLNLLYDYKPLNIKY